MTQKRVCKTLLFSLIVSLLALSCSTDQKEKLTIATAANMQFAMKALTEAFSNKTGIQCQTILGSSGKLTAQITAGAPYDLFVSADLHYPQTLYQQGLSTVPPSTYAYGKLVLWTRLEQDIDSIVLMKLNHLAMANPKTAPYGRAAMQALNYQGLDSLLSEKLVYGESIAQVNQFVNSGAADAGFTAMAVVLAPGIAGKGQWMEIDSTFYEPIAQGVIILNSRKSQQNDALLFHKFLFSETAKGILQNFGYTAAQE